MQRLVCLMVVAAFLSLGGGHANAAEIKRQRQSCEALAGDSFNLLPGAPTQVITATWRPDTPQRRAYCDVAGYVGPASQFGLWLPGEGWNGKYIVRGCGGSCGIVAMEVACAAHLRDGYACLQSDMGHRSTQLDNLWVIDNLMGQIDFGYRATHVTAVAGKAILKAFYQTDPRYSYFFACSTGGRQAMIEAQRFPDDFDGVIAIAPVSMGSFNGGKPRSPRPADFNRRPDGGPILPNRKIPMLHRAVLARCDMDDGLKDGLVGNPPLCRFDPASLLCKAGDSQNCLTAEQVAVARRFYDDMHMEPGSEIAWINFLIEDRYPDPQPDNPYRSRGDPAVAETLVSPNNPDLSGFRDHGGKLIMAHGWADTTVIPGPTVRYFDMASRTMGGPQAMHDFARLFMVPGMEHCTAGEGAYAIDWLKYLEDWVERGKAPAALLGRRPKDGVTVDYFGSNLKTMDASQFAFSRPIYDYPSLAVYSGKGDPADASSFRPKIPGTAR